MISGGINLVMTVIGFTVSIMFIVFICTRLICARIQLSASRRPFASSSRSDLSMLERGLHGLEPVVVANFPTKTYCDECYSANKDAHNGDLLGKHYGRCFHRNGHCWENCYSGANFWCTVCLSEYRREDTLRILPYCGHSFHVTCIDIWLQQHSTCPVCRISLREFPEKKRSLQPLFSSGIGSQYSTESLDTHAYNCLLRGQGFPSRTQDNPAIDRIEQTCCATRGNGNPEAGENMSCTIEDDDDAIKDSRKKLVECPLDP